MKSFKDVVTESRMTYVFLVIEEKRNGVEIVWAAFPSESLAKDYIKRDGSNPDSGVQEGSRLYVDRIPFFSSGRPTGEEELRAIYSRK